MLLTIPEWFTRVGETFARPLVEATDEELLAMLSTRGPVMTIREATLDRDGLEIVVMTEQFLKESIYGRFFPFNSDQVMTLIVNVLQLGAVFLAEEGERIVGMLAVVKIPHQISGEVFAEEIAWWVSPEHRGASIGPRLLRHMEEWARAEGLGMVKIGAPVDKPEVAAYYERLGYTAVETAYAKRF